jgi:hypothetical protein
MKAKRLLSISAFVFAAAWITSDAGMAMAQTKGKDSKTIHPDVNQSVGGSQSERTGSDTQTPLPDKSPMTGTVEKESGSTQGSGSKSSKGTSQSGKKDSTTIHPDLNPSVGGSQSERTDGDSGTPLPKKSPSTGTVEKGSGSSR